MRVGVIGCGYWGSKHVRVFEGLEGVERTVLIDPRAGRREALQASFPRTRSFARLEEAVEHLDAVVIATPPSTHADLGLRALDAGLHVLVEKPLATSSADAALLVNRAEAAGKTLMVGHTFEHNAAVWKLRDLVATGVLGDVLYVDTARLNLGLYQQDINVIWDLAPHDVSIINHVLGTAPQAVHAWGSSHASPLEDVAYIKLEYPHVTAQVHVSWLDPCKVRRVTVVGSRQMAVYNDLADEERIRVYDKGVDAGRDPGAAAGRAGQDMHAQPVSYRYGGITAPYIAFQEPLAVQDRAFVDCVRDGTRPLTDGYRGLAVVQALEAAQRSLREGRPIDLRELQAVEAA